MIGCAVCSSSVVEGSHFCSNCGSDLEQASRGPASTTLLETARPTASVHDWSAGKRISSSPFDGGRFLPGTMIAGRYRIVGLVGRGGMGEVYRADDLKLGQTVALKFLPEALETDEARLAGFLNEVKIARQISHPNVCRVYDVGLVHGHHFLSMEYVDGEDLASLLRRIGRLPRDKAIQLAQQICAGVAAAHQQGVLHRDLKPANVMIDGRGRARIMDFGLAILAGEKGGAGGLAGTPGYIAPEQLSGASASVAGDVYSLGLVLYELFTGQPAFKASTIAELVRLQLEAAPPNPSALVEGLDPAVSKIIVGCLEREPRDRPRGALQVAAAMPGSDALAAALAAGDTPSPELVAAVEAKGLLPPWIAATLLGAVFLGVAAYLPLAQRWWLTARVPMPKTPDALADRATEILARLGRSVPMAEVAYGLSEDRGYLGYLSRRKPTPSKWTELANGRPAAVRFWYRQSPKALLPRLTNPWLLELRVTPLNPPPYLAGMISMTLDTQGRLLEFLSIPERVFDPSIGSLAPHTEPTWEILFAEAGLDERDWTPAAPIWSPPVPCDRQSAWTGAYKENPGLPIRIEGCQCRGRIIAFMTLAPWNMPVQAPDQAVGPMTGQIQFWLSWVFHLGILLGGLWMARRNLRSGRGDRRAALRVAVFASACIGIFWVLGGSRLPFGYSQNVNFIELVLACALFQSLLVWVLYIALEPYVRRHWPHLLVSWSRLLSGRWRDPLVGRDLLIGAASGILPLVVVSAIDELGRGFLGLPGRYPQVPDFDAFPGFRDTVGLLSAYLWFTLRVAMICLALPLAIQTIVRRRWLAMLLFWALSVPAWWIGIRDQSAWNFVLWAAMTGVMILVTVEVGLLAGVAAVFFAYTISAFAASSSPAAWYGTPGLTLLGVLTAVACYGFFVCLAGRPLFREISLKT